MTTIKLEGRTVYVVAYHLEVVEAEGTSVYETYATYAEALTAQKRWLKKEGDRLATILLEVE